MQLYNGELIWLKDAISISSPKLFQQKPSQTKKNTEKINYPLTTAVAGQKEQGRKMKKKPKKMNSPSKTEIEIKLCR